LIRTFDWTLHYLVAKNRNYFIYNEKLHKLHIKKRSALIKDNCLMLINKIKLNIIRCNENIITLKKYYNIIRLKLLITIFIKLYKVFLFCLSFLLIIIL